MEFAGLAQDFVEATSLLVGGRTINIMDKRGIIIASTENHRVNTFHQGAAEVIATGKSVVIHREDLDRYPGAKEGFNMPIFLEEDLIGVVGIYGEENEVRDIANLLKVYVTQYFRQQEWMLKEKRESELRTRILKLLVCGDEAQADAIAGMCSALFVRIGFPMKLYLFSTVRSEEERGRPGNFSRLEQALLWQGIIDRRRDIYGIYENHYLILHGGHGEDEAQNVYGEKLARFARDYESVRLAVSGTCGAISELPRGVSEVFTLSAVVKDCVSDIRDCECRMRYLTCNLLGHGGSYYAKQMYQRLAADQDESHIETLLVTAGVYYQENGSVARAAGRLHLHKNTLLYRMGRIFELLGLSEEKAYVKEFFIRMLLEYHPVALPGEQAT